MLKYKYIVFLMLIISCKTNNSKETQLNNVAYDLINDVLKIVYEERLERIERLNHHQKQIYLKHKQRINPEYLISFLSTEKIDSAFIFTILRNKPLLKNGKGKVACENYNNSFFEISKHKKYYASQINKAPDSIDFSKIKNEYYRSFDTIIRKPNHIKTIEAHKEIGYSIEQLKRLEKRYLHEENGAFSFSYPMISKNKQYALMFLNYGGGVQLWILEKTNNTWKKNCVLQIANY